IPHAWIVTDTSRDDPSGGAGGRDASPEAKAWARSATLEIGSAEERRDVADRFGDVTYFKRKPRFQLEGPLALGPIIQRAGKLVDKGEDLGRELGPDFTGVGKELVKVGEGVGKELVKVGEEVVTGVGKGLAATGGALVGVGDVLVATGGVLVDAGALVADALE